MKGRINKIQIIVGFNVLFLGILYYYFFRVSEHTYFIQLFNNPPFLKENFSLFQKYSNNLPTFIHVFAFSLITSGLIAQNKKGYAAVCFFWFGINVLFELGQKFNKWVIQFVPNWFQNIVFLENTKSYFQKGSFDYFDLFSITLGVLMAYIFLINTIQKGGRNEKQTINCS